jgi:multiple sugar transport system ATP-binding protein
MCHELRSLHDRLGATTIYVTHDQLEAMSLADRMAVMKAGVVEQIGPPQELYDKPASMFVADFLGSPPMNFLKVHTGLDPDIESIRLEGAQIGIPRPIRRMAPAELALGIRPEHIRFVDGAAFRGGIVAVEYLGTTQLVTLDTSHGRLKARLPSSAPARVGETVGLSFPARRLSLFETASGRAIETLRPGEAAHG